ncbi:MAG: CBS domain-containing protein [Candidatus Binatia bacterium]
MITVAQWMTRQVLAVELYDSIGIARRIMSKHRINQLPVLDADKLVGIVTDRDIRDAYPTSILIGHAKEIDKFADSYTVEVVMAFNVLTVRPETPLANAVKLLRRHRIGSLPVVKNRKLVGIITRSDVLDFILSGKSLKQGADRKGRRKVSSAVASPRRADLRGKRQKR